MLVSARAATGERGEVVQAGGAVYIVHRGGNPAIGAELGGAARRALIGERSKRGKESLSVW